MTESSANTCFATDDSSSQPQAIFTLEVHGSMEIAHHEDDRRLISADRTAGNEDDETSSQTLEKTLPSATSDDVRRHSGTSRGSLVNDNLRGSNTSLNSKTKRNSSLTQKLSTSDFTVNKLQFRNLGRLYGRDKECRLLREAWEAVRESNSHESRNLPHHGDAGMFHTGGPRRLHVRRFVSISGDSGTGKSTLAESLRASVLHDGAFFLTGKFPQQRRLSSIVEPYSAFEGVCRDLCELVASQCSIKRRDTDASSNVGDGESVVSRKKLNFALSEFREHLSNELGADTFILTRVIPVLLQILEAGSASESIGPREAHHQFKFAFRRLVRAITSFAPIVMVLDDMQWGDTASMELLETLLSDKESNALLIIGCYRCEDIYSRLPHVKAIDSIRSLTADDPCLVADDIFIGNLDVDEVNELLGDLLSLGKSETLSLATCIHRKTAGNIFFVIQFLTSLYESEMLVYNMGALKWTFDLHAIHQSTVATDNVVSLVKSKMSKLSPTIVTMLPVMGCLGSTFSVAVFELVARHYTSSWDADPEDSIGEENQDDPEQNRPPSLNQKAVQCLIKCDEEGLIEECTDDGQECYRWVHDKIQEASFSLLTDEALQELKLRLGKILHEQLDSSELDKHLFLVANLLSTDRKCSDFLSLQQPISVAKLYLRAGVKAIENSAFVQAAGYLRIGMKLLPTNHWQTEYRLSLELYSTAAEAEFCIGNFDQMKLYCNEVLDQVNRPLFDHRRVYNVLIDYAAAEQNMASAFSLCQTVLAKMQCKFPKRLITLHALGGIVQLKPRMKTITEEVIAISELVDEEKRWLMTLLDKFTTYTYLTKPAILPLVIFKGFGITLSHGVSEYSLPMLAFLGLLLVASLHDFHGGLALGNLAIDRLKQVSNSRKVEARVIHVTQAFLHHWLRPLALSIKPLLVGYEVGLSMGDTGSAGWCIYFALEHAFRTGTSLHDVRDDCEFYADRLREVKQLKILGVLLNLWQTVLFLIGEDPYRGPLSGSIVDQGKGLSEVASDAYDYSEYASLRVQMYIAFVLNEHEAVYDSIRKTSMDKGRYETIFPGIAGIYYLYAYNGFSMLSLYRNSKQRKFLKLARKFASRIKRWVVAGNPNVAHFDALFDAEFDSLAGRNYAAAGHFEVAILFAGRSGLTQDFAMAHERYGEHLARLGPDRIQDAEFHLKEALVLFEEWGAAAKVQQVQKAHEHILSHRGEFQIEHDF